MNDKRRAVLRWLADRFDPGESGFVKAKHLQDDLDYTAMELGVMLARLAGDEPDKYEHNPTPVFEIEIWRETSNHRLYQVRRPGFDAAADALDDDPYSGSQSTNAHP